jgi:uncharacterized protein
MHAQHTPAIPAPLSSKATDVAPWYRHRWPWYLMAGPAFVVVAGFHIMYVAFTGADGLVVKDYYKRGLTINQDHARDEVARRDGIAVTLQVAPEGVLAGWSASQPAGAPANMTVRFMHVGQQDLDRTLLLRRNMPEQWTAPSISLTPGRYRVVVETPQWRIVRSIDTRGISNERFAMTLDARQ